MKVTTFAKAAVSASAVAALTLGLSTTAFAVTGPTATQEDPTGTPAATTLVGVGSDTTQDVMYGVAQAINAGQATPVIASYTATGGTTITYRSGKATARPNGSGAGYKALNDSIGLTAAGNANAGDVDFARASGTQGIAATGTSGVTTDIPFAVDTMGVAVPAGSPFLLTNAGAGLTITDLYNIYAGVDTYVDTTDGSLETAAGTNRIPIHAFVPKPTSGSRQFFLTQLATQGQGIAVGTNKGDSLYTANTYSATGPFIGAVDSAGAAVQEHDATVLTSEPSTVAAIAPFSGAKFIGYHNGKIADPDAGRTAGTDYKLVPFKSTVAGGESGVLPYTDNAGVYAPNAGYKTYATKGTEGAAFNLFRDVYNIIPTAAWKNPTANAKYALLNSTFVGATSKVCQAASAITAFGFLTADNCGATTKTYDTPSTATVTPSVKTAGVAGKSTVFNVNVQSNGNGGGTATITVAGKDYTGTVAAGQTDGTVTVPTPAAGTFAYTGTFTPNLAGVAPAQMAPGSFAVAKAPVVAPVKVNATIRAVAPKVSHTKKAKVAVTVTASRTVPTGKVTVVVKKGTRTLVTVANRPLVSGKAVVTLTKKLKKGSYAVFVSYTGDAKVNRVALRSVTTLKVK
ncbi:hypothetical protein GCM10009798_32670 [Nocardioides panacihumi]|uniref:Bacterial Ig-like domain-containing protein n=1 Tax=Nocardioides panacihumi TaxID=400774 RepID=A0ABN2RI95_9ACTN